MTEPQIIAGMGAMIAASLFYYGTFLLVKLTVNRHQEPEQHNHAWLVSYFVWEDTKFQMGHKNLFSRVRYDTAERFKELHEYIANDLKVDKTKLVIISINKL